MSCPFSVTEPWSAGYTPEITLKIVVLPAPLGPMMPWIWPASAASEKS